MTAANVYLFLHVLGFVLWIGVTVTLAFVTGRAARSEEPGVAAFAYRTASRLMKTLGLGGMVLTMAGGFGLTAARGLPLFEPFPHHALFQMQLLGSLAFLVAVLYQIPLSDRLARAAEASAAAGEESAAFRKYRKRAAIVGSILGTVLLIVLALGILSR